MKIVGIVTEHNPFHNGHRYHVEKAQEACNADAVISVMSGHFLQRGEPALFNKWARAEMAVLAGADIVIELPTAFSVRSASVFAHGAVSILNSTGIVTHLCFGSESGNLDSFLPPARLLSNEPEEFRSILNRYLNTGISYPAARAKALEAFLPKTDEAENLYASPNNILGIEYVKALFKLNSAISPVTVKRFAAGYHDVQIGRQQHIASATSIREEILNSGNTLTPRVKQVVPETSYSIMEKELAAGRGPVFMESFSQSLFYLLRTVPAEYLASICDVNEGLEFRLLECSKKASSVKNLIELVKTKRYTWTRIQRIISNLLLGYTSSMADSFDATGPRYIRILGLSAKGRSLLKITKKRADVPVIVRTAPYLARKDELSAMLRFDVKATDIYMLLYPRQSITQQGLDCKVMPFVEMDLT